MNILSFVSVASGPVIGAAIGYFTNYIAVKMLFCPRKEVRVFGVRLPFTPGIIPKRRKELATAIGATVERKLLTKDTVCEFLTSDAVKNSVAMELTNSLCSEKSIGELLSFLTPQQKSDGALPRYIARRAVSAISSVDAGSIIMSEAKPLIKERFGGLAAMLVSDEMLASFAAPVNDRIATYLTEHIDDMVVPLVSDELDKLKEQSAEELIFALGADNTVVFSLISSLYTRLTEKYGGSIAERFAVADIIEKKINEMDIKEIEDMVLSTMKRELDAVVRLGALVGFVIGFLNIFFK